MGRFVIVNAVAAPECVIDSHEKVVLSATDWEAFHEALLDPPEPNAMLREAVRRYRERVGECNDPRYRTVRSEP